MIVRVNFLIGMCPVPYIDGNRMSKTQPVMMPLRISYSSVSRTQPLRSMLAQIPTAVGARVMSGTGSR